MTVRFTSDYVGFRFAVVILVIIMTLAGFAPESMQLKTDFTLWEMLIPIGSLILLAYWSGREPKNESSS